ncbi:MAG: shikimate dehydrogenase [Bacteroidota bacterium]
MTFGLIGYPLSHSFSQGYFTNKFAQLGLADTHRYRNFAIEDFRGFGEIMAEYPDIRGLNVTIPHKRNVIPYLDELDPVAERIGAVNCITVDEAGKMKGFNTDYLGFRDDFLSELTHHQSALTKETLAGQQALVLGTGGASLAVHEGLRSLGIITQAVSRRAGTGQITYGDVTPELLHAHLIVINTTPLGMSPKVEGFPDLPYADLSQEHFCYDLVYNPAETAFLRKARAAGASGANGMGMLERQAEAGWKIWTGEG